MKQHKRPTSASRSSARPVQRRVTRDERGGEPEQALPNVAGWSRVADTANRFGNGAAATIARQTPPAHSAPVQTAPVQTAPVQSAPASIDLGGVHMETARELGVWLLVKTSELRSSFDELSTSGGEEGGAPIGMMFILGEGQALLRDCVAHQDQAAATYGDRARQWAANWVAAMTEGEQLKLQRAAAKLAEAKRQAQAASDGVEELVPKLRADMRAKFRHGDEDGLTATSDAIMGWVDTGLAAKNSLDTISETLADLRFAEAATRTGTGMRVGVPMNVADFRPTAAAKIPKVLACLESINKVYAAYQTIRSVNTILSGGTGVTETQQGGSMVEASATLFSAGGTLLGVAGNVSLYANLYLGPMTSAAIRQLNALSDVLSEANQPLIEEGYFGMVRWGNEPGGRRMAEFMVGVMHASDPSEIGRIPGELLSYFDKNQDPLEAGVKTEKTGSDEMPEDGWIFKDLNEAGMRRWLFRHRENVWSMFYGSIRVPTRIRESPLDP